MSFKCPKNQNSMQLKLSRSKNKSEMKSKRNLGSRWGRSYRLVIKSLLSKSKAALCNTNFPKLTRKKRNPKEKYLKKKQLKRVKNSVTSGTKLSSKTRMWGLIAYPSNKTSEGNGCLSKARGLRVTWTISTDKTYWKIWVKKSTKMNKMMKLRRFMLRSVNLQF